MNQKPASHFKPRAAAVAVAACLAMAPWFAEAAGLGKITVFSNLGQPLRAEVEVSATRDELSGMSARLAPLEAFRQASVDYAGGLSDLHFALDRRADGTSVIRVTSSKPINEPFLDFLVELNWNAGRLVREYTFLLDPVEVAAKSAGKAVSVAEAKPVEGLRDRSEAETAAPVKEATGRSGARKPKAAEEEPKKADAAATRVVRRGETLRKIASEAQYEGVSLEQMLVALFRSNSDAFIGANINRMRAGAILTIPDKDAVAAIPASEAKKEYRAQAADWNAYRRKLAAAAAQGPAKDETAGQTAGGKITAKVDEKAAPAEGQKDQVKVSRSDADAKAAGGKGGVPSEEEKIAKEKALKEAQERLALLEKNVGELQKLVEMKNQRLAELQKQAAAPKPDEAKPAEAPKTVEPPKAADAAKPAEVAKAPEPAKPLEVPKAPVADEAAKPAEAAKPPEPPAPAPAPAPKPAEVRKTPPPPPPPEPEPDFLDEFMLPLAGGGGILALLAAYFIAKRRRGGKAAAKPSATAPHPSSLGPNSVFRATGGQSVDTGNTTPQTTDFSQTGPGTIDTDEVDPVAEADVYMAYGRDAQAEEILLEALQKDPQRVAIHAKLLEIYAGRKSVKQFETLAGELYAQTGGKGPEWDKVAAMGAKLDPSNPLYSGATGEIAGAAAAPEIDTGAFDADATLIVSPTEALKAGMAMADPAPTTDAPAVADPFPSLDMAAAPVPEPVPAAMPDEEAKAADAGLMSLDFDLDSTLPAASPVAAADSANERAFAETVATGLDFDLGMATPEAGAATELAAAMAAGKDAGALDFDLDLGAPAGEAPPAAAVQEAAASPSTGEATEIEMIDFDLAEVPLPVAEVKATEIPAAAAALPQGDQEIVDFSAVDGDALEFDVKLSDSAVLGQPVPPPSFDLSSINLDLAAEGGDAVPASPAEPSAEDVMVADEPVLAEADARWEEVSTKLDLAKAYEEMGDLEGARELLGEVVGDGPTELVEQARAILARLNG